MQVKKFNISLFEAWNKNNQNYNEFIGGYFCKIKVTGGFGCKGNFKNVFEAYISDNDVSCLAVFSSNLNVIKMILKNLKIGIIV